MEVLTLLQKVQKSYARHYLAKFSNKDLDRVIEPFWENSQSSQKDWEIAEARHKCLENVKAWKCKALKAMKIKISEAQSSNGLHLGTLREAPDIMKYFLNVYRPEKLIQIFCFTKAFLDVKTTSEWGLWFLKNIYANLATQKKPQEEAGAWLEILEFWDQMASDRGAGELAKARAEYFGVRPEKKRETVKRPRKSLNGRIFLSEEMPPLPVYAPPALQIAD
ncbi:hypothetical protein V8E54_001282 [Elaphomyces granulatus]